MIKTIHRIWLGPRPMPEAYKEYGRAWTNLNPGWEVLDWSWASLPEDLANAEVLEDMRKRSSTGTSVELPTAQADVISYELVYRYGGIYANADIQPIRPLSNILGHLQGGAWATYEEDNYPLIVNAFFGAPFPKNAFWGDVVSGLHDNYFSLNSEGTESVEMVFSSGPHYLTGKSDRRLNVLPYYTVNPVLWKDVPSGSDATIVIDSRGGVGYLPQNCVGIHHWGHRKSGRSNVVR